MVCRTRPVFLIAVVMVPGMLLTMSMYRARLPLSRDFWRWPARSSSSATWQ